MSAKSPHVVQFWSRSKDLGDIPSFGNWRRYLSNFCTEISFCVDMSKVAGCSVFPSVLRFRSAEHAFQAVKYTYSTKPLVAFELSENIKTPLEARRAGSKTGMKKHRAMLDVKQWDARREAVMQHILQARFAQDSKFRAILQFVRVHRWYLQHYENRVAHNKAFWGGDKNVLGCLLMNLHLHKVIE